MDTCGLNVNQYTERCTSLQGGNERLPLFGTRFVPLWIKFGAADAHKNLLSNCECRATWRSEIPSVLDGINLLLLLLLVILNYMPVIFLNTANG